MIGGHEPAGATLLGASELAGLRPTWITTRQDLDEAEQANILAGLTWAKRTRRRDLLSEPFIVSLHRNMFGDVWTWAGTFRQRETNIGVLPHLVGPSLRELIDTARYWVDDRPFPADEIAVRLHHRMVQIHPFPNGNGRHTRAMADLLIEELGGVAFTWGQASLLRDGPARADYIAALQAADNLDITPLLAFARS